MNKKYIKGLASLLIIVLMVSTVSCKMSKSKCLSKVEMQQVANMGLGINIGNSLDSLDYKKGAVVSDYETYWGNPHITKKYIHSLKKAGFNTIRLPITWFDHTDDELNIDDRWMNRVEEVVNMILDEDMYCIINTHHEKDANTIVADKKNYKTYSGNLIKYWSQIAERFKNYDPNKLMFEGFNEIRDPQGNWVNPDDSSIECTNLLNQDFVNTVRKSGGKNNKRWLICNTYAASCAKNEISKAVEPDDVEKRVIMSVHCYQTDMKQVDKTIKLLKRYFMDEGYPVVIGEWGMALNHSQEDIQRYSYNFVKKCEENGIVCIYWEDGKYKKISESSFGLFNRSTGRAVFPETVHEMNRGYKDGKK